MEMNNKLIPSNKRTLVMPETIYKDEVLVERVNHQGQNLLPEMTLIV